MYNRKKKKKPLFSPPIYIQMSYFYLYLFVFFIYLNSNTSNIFINKKKKKLLLPKFLRVILSHV